MSDVKIQAVLRILASQESCDGEPYDQMVEAAEHIDRLEAELAAVKASSAQVMREAAELLEFHTNTAACDAWDEEDIELIAKLHKAIQQAEGGE